MRPTSNATSTSSLRDEQFTCRGHSIEPRVHDGRTGQRSAKNTRQRPPPLLLDLEDEATLIAHSFENLSNVLSNVTRIDEFRQRAGA